MKIDTTRFHAAFFDEATEHLADVEECLLALEQAPDDAELLNRLFRAAHSIKGASGTFGFQDIAHFTHGMEGMLDRLRDGRLHTTPELLQILLHSADALSALVAVAKDGGSLPSGLEQLTQAMQAACEGGLAKAGETPAAASASAPSQAGIAREYTIHFQPGREIFHCGMDPLLLLRDLNDIGEILELTADTSKLPDLESLVPDECFLSWTIRLRSDKAQDEIQAVFVFVEDCSRISIEARECALAAQAQTPSLDTASVPHNSVASPAPAAVRQSATETSSIRVSVEKVDELINLVGELVIAQSMVNQAIGKVPPDILSAMQEALTAMNRSTHDLQERVMSVRMLPLANVFRRFPRLVRDLAASMNKQIHVEISGEDTELDKQMIEQIADPLTHLIRNAVDHGIEMPDHRQTVGKPPVGTIRLHAYHEGGNVVIDVVDDGRGLDSRRIREKALSFGLVGPDDTLSDAQLHELIFAPGFSTAERVSDISGRGVGMDVVKRNIESLNGSVEIRSETGQGSTFRIRLPLTMAILDGLAAGLGGYIYIFPLLSVIESFRPKPTDVKTIIGTGEAVIVRGKPLPLVRLHRIFNCPGVVTEPCRGLVVIVENQGKKFCVLVDDLLGQMQVVMKSIETNYQKIEGVSAATILGDGDVAFILDIPGLNRLAKKNSVP